LKFYSGHDHPEVCQVLKLLGTALFENGQVTQANLKARKALEIAEKLFDGYQQPILIKIYQLLSRVSNKQYEYTQSRRYLERAIEIARQLYENDEHVVLVALLRDLAFAFFNEGSYRDAAEAYKRVIQVSQKLARSELYPNIGSDIYDLGRCLSLEGAMDEAQIVLEHGTQVCKDDDQIISKIYQEIGWIAVSQGQDEAAQTWFQRCLKSDVSGRNKDEALMATMFHELGRGYYEEGKFVEAISHFSESLEMSRRYHGTEDHPNYATTIGCVAQVYYDQGELAKSIECLNKAYSTCKRTLGEGHPTTTFFQSKLASIQQNFKKSPEIIEVQ